MLERNDRLRHMRDFALLSQKGRVVFGPLFTLRFRLSQTSSRIGFVASTKLFKRAVARNRVKRRMRAVLREMKQEWPVNMDLLFILKPDAKEAPFTDLIESVRKAFSKIPSALAEPIRPRPMKARRKTSVIYKQPHA